MKPLPAILTDPLTEAERAAIGPRSDRGGAEWLAKYRRKLLGQHGRNEHTQVTADCGDCAVEVVMWIITLRRGYDPLRGFKR